MREWCGASSDRSRAAGPLTKPHVLNSPRWRAYHGAARDCHCRGEGLLGRMSWFVRTLLSLALTVWTAAAVAQSADNPGADIFTQGLVAPNLDAEMGAP